MNFHLIKYLKKKKFLPFCIGVPKTIRIEIPKIKTMKFIIITE